MRVYYRALLLLLLLGGGHLTAHAQSLRILYYSSAPEIIRDEGRPSLAQVATIVRQEREKADNILFVHGGASLGPSILGALDRGAHMIDVLNMLEPDLMAVGKREFSYKEDQFTLHAMSAGFPFISSNIIDSASDLPLEGVEKSLLLRNGDFSVGFIALTSDNAITQYGASALATLPTDNTVRKIAAQLRNEGADAIVILADTDYNDLSVYTHDQTTNAVLYAHNFDNPFSVDACGQTLKKGALDGKLISLTFTMTGPKPNGKISCQVETIDLYGAQQDPEVQALIRSYASRLEILLNQEIAVTEANFNTIREEVRTKESPFGNMVADAVRNAMQADIAFLNSGGIRGNRYYKSGQTLTREDIQLELPFNNTVELFEITGAQLQAAFEWGTGCVETVDGCFLQVSNLTVTFDPDQPLGKRIKSILVGGEPLVMGRTYRLGTLNFLGEGGDGFTMLKDMPRLTQAGAGKLLWEVVASYLGNQGRINPQSEGRLISVAPSPPSAVN